MISEKMEAALNQQLNAELFASYLYLSMAAYLETTPYEGMAHWMKEQSKEEYGHAMKFFEYINEVGKRAKLETLEAPKFEWQSPKAAFEGAYEHELKVTKMINDLVALSRQENDYATESFLNYFVKEQVEEVSSVTKIIEKFNAINGSVGGLFYLDKSLGKRE